MEWELSRQAWLRLREMKRSGIDVARVHEQITQALERLDEIPVVLQRQNRFVITTGQWRLALRKHDGQLTVLDIEFRLSI